MHASPSSTPTHTTPAPDASNADPEAAVAVPPDSAVVDVELANDVEMTEQDSSHPNSLDAPVGLGLDINGDATPAAASSTNGAHANGDAPTPSVEHLAIQTPEHNNLDTSPSDTTTAVTRLAPDEEADRPPPAKRARRLSNSEQASLVHVSVYMYIVAASPMLIYSSRLSLTVLMAKAMLRARRLPAPPHHLQLPSVSSSIDSVSLLFVISKRAKTQRLSSILSTTLG